MHGAGAASKGLPCQQGTGRASDARTQYPGTPQAAFDELKSQWGWGGFTTHDLHRCQLSARAVALIYNWWSLFVRLAHPEARLDCHVAFERPALSRKERADQLKKRDVFTKYGEQARAVLSVLLDNYADAGIDGMEDIKILTLDPFSRLGTAPELIKSFGGKPAYLQAVQELEQQLYA